MRKIARYELAGSQDTNGFGINDQPKFYPGSNQAAFGNLTVRKQSEKISVAEVQQQLSGQLRSGLLSDEKFCR